MHGAAAPGRRNHPIGTLRARSAARGGGRPGRGGLGSAGLALLRCTAPRKQLFAVRRGRRAGLGGVRGREGVGVPSTGAPQLLPGQPRTQRLFAAPAAPCVMQAEVQQVGGVDGWRGEGVHGDRR